MNSKTMKVITLVTGILTLLLGLYTIVRPFRTFLAIGWILGILILMNGIELIMMSLTKEQKEVGACILGVLEVIAGLILLSSGFLKFLTDVTAVFMVGFSIVMYGIFQIVKGFQMLKVSKGTGIFGIVCGVLFITQLSQQIFPNKA